MKIGFIGLGIMGKPMVRNLMKAGHELVVFNRSQPAIDEMVAEGATGATSYAEVGASCPVIITMVPNAPNVADVLLGDSGVLSTAPAGTIVIDMSSIAPDESKKFASICAETGARFLDAPVTGGELGAINASLTIMCGGEESLYSECVEILSAMGSKTVYCGASGAGNSAKLVNQVVVAGNIAVMAEGLMLARMAGIDPAVTYEAICGGLAQSAVMDTRGKKILDGDTSPSFSIELHLKDLTNVLDTAHATGAPTPLTSQIADMFQLLKHKGMGKLDHSALSKYYEILSQTSIV